MGEVAVHVIAVAEIEAAFTAVGGTHRTGEAVEGIVLIVVAAATDGIFTAEDVIRTVVAVMEVADQRIGAAAFDPGGDAVEATAVGVVFVAGQQAVPGQLTTDAPGSIMPGGCP